MIVDINNFLKYYLSSDIVNNALIPIEWYHSFRVHLMIVNLEEYCMHEVHFQLMRR